MYAIDVVFGRLFGTQAYRTSDHELRNRNARCHMSTQADQHVITRKVMLHRSTIEVFTKLVCTVNDPFVTKVWLMITERLVDNEM